MVWRFEPAIRARQSMKPFAGIFMAFVVAAVYFIVNKEGGKINYKLLVTELTMFVIATMVSLLLESP
jgi:hypothetical protein